MRVLAFRTSFSGSSKCGLELLQRLLGRDESQAGQSYLSFPTDLASGEQSSLGQAVACSLAYRKSGSVQ